MLTYNKLATLLRTCGDLHGECDLCPYQDNPCDRMPETPLIVAADAIEELCILLTASNEVVAKGRGKWISVEEKLPDAMPGNYSLDVLVTDGDSIAICQYFNGDGCDSMWGYSGIGEITHWMPLPEKPKEAT